MNTLEGCSFHGWMLSPCICTSSHFSSRLYFSTFHWSRCPMITSTLCPSGPPWSSEFRPNFSSSYWAQTPSGLMLGCQACSQIRSKWRPPDKQLPALLLLSLCPSCFPLPGMFSVSSGQSQLKFHMLRHPFFFPKARWCLSLLNSQVTWHRGFNRLGPGSPLLSSPLGRQNSTVNCTALSTGPCVERVSINSCPVTSHMSDRER